MEVRGLEQLEGEGGLLLAPNHPNGLIDPLVVLSHGPGRVSFLAKAPLFRAPLVRHFVRGLDCLPVYRPQDGYDAAMNRETLSKAAELLNGGGTIAIFPEGKSHDEPGLEALKTGPARIALGARATGATVRIVPCAIFYEDKSIFRSRVFLSFGPPIDVPRVALDETGEPPREAARALTEALRAGLEDELVAAESHDVLELAALAAAAIRGARRDREDADSLPRLSVELRGDGPLARERDMRRHLIRRYREASASHRATLESLRARLVALEGHFRDAGLELDAPARPQARARHGLARAGFGPRRSLLLRAAMATFGTPAALVGLAINYPAYRMVGLLAPRLAKSDRDVVSTAKLLFGMLAFPLSWLAFAVGVGSYLWLRDLGLALALGASTLALALGPPLASLTLAWVETLELLRSWVRTFGLRWSRKEAFAALVVERDEIYEALLALDAQLNDESPTTASD